MKKTLIFSNYDDPKNPYYAGGGAIAVHEVARRLAKKNRVIVLTGNYPGAQTGTFQGVEYQRIGPAHVHPKLGQLLFVSFLPFYAVTKKFDVWFECFTPPFSTTCIPLFTRKPVVGITHFLLAKEKAKEYKLPFDIVEKIGLKLYKHIIVLIKETKEYVLSCNPTADVAIIPNGVTIQKCPVTPKPKEKYMFFLGRLEIEQKGIDLLLKAFALAAPKTSLQLYIGGNGIPAAEKKVKQMITELHLENRVKLLGRVERKMKTQLYCHAAFFVLPSRYETLGMTALEAMSLCTPILCFRAPGLSWIDDKIAVKVPAFSIEKFAQKIIELDKKPALLTTMSKNMQDVTKNFNWDTMAARYQQVIDKITS